MEGDLSAAIAADIKALWDLQQLKDIVNSAAEEDKGTSGGKDVRLDLDDNAILCALACIVS